MPRLKGSADLLEDRRRDFRLLRYLQNYVSGAEKRRK
jgi:hypothetical protein